MGGKAFQSMTGSPSARVPSCFRTVAYAFQQKVRATRHQIEEREEARY
jgi:hypothetical protein